MWVAAYLARAGRSAYRALYRQIGDVFVVISNYNFTSTSRCHIPHPLIRTVQLKHALSQLL